MPKEFIVAIELGSSKMTGIAGRRNLDDSISVLAVVNEDASACIRKGVIYNIDKTVLALTNIVKKLEGILKTKVAQVYVGVGGQSIRSIRNVVVKELPADTAVSQEMVNSLMDANRNMAYPEQEILDAITQEYKVDQQFQLDPVGIQCTRLEGNFLNILWRKTFYKNLNKCFEMANIPIAEMYLAPLAMADSVLTETERRTGCVLVDLGADTTTVSVYYRNLLRHLVVIPLGSNNITKDIASLQMEDAEAEKMKLKYAKAYTDRNDIDETLTLPIDSERSVESVKFINIVEARLDEIIENVWHQVPNEYEDKLLGGIILTGGGSNMKNIERAFRNHTRIEKIRIASFITQPINSSNAEINAHDGKMNTILGLLEKGDMNCAGPEITGDIFADSEDRVAGQDNRPVRPINEQMGRGVVQTEADKERAEEEERRQREIEEERKRQEELERKRQEEEERRQNSIPRKIVRWLKKFGGTLIEEEE